MSKDDPKHGRWILPLVVAGLIAFTVIFVRALPAADVAASTTTTSTTTTTTTTETTTTTTLPADIRAFLGELDRFDTTVKDLSARLTTANESWENRDVDLETTRTTFQEISDAHQAMANEVAAATVPDVYREVWPDTITLSLDLVTKTDAVITGLEAPDDGTLRREAVAAYEEAVSAFLAQLAAVRAAGP